jgi:UDP-N-acetylglucosamine diphosphorylase/glucosamine-1-phosphate N-acetyltransferase
MKVAGRINGTVHESAILDRKENIHVAEGAEVHPGAILLGGEGPVCIGPGAKVMAGAVLEGPVSVGRKSSVKILAKIYEGTSIGEFCKIGGEVEECIFQAYSNKQHDGFKGHSFYGEWINIGADGNNSDLKNNYSNVKVFINGKPVDTGSMFVGSTVGDHSKSGINSMFNTGTVVGVGCNIYGANFPPKYIPSFCWGGSGGFVEHKLDKFLSTAEKVMARRKRELTPAGRKMLETVFKATAEERKTVMK